MQRAFICLSVKSSCLAEAQEPIKLCDHFKKVYVYDLQNPPSRFIQMLTQLFSEAPVYLCIPFNRNSVESRYTKPRQDQEIHSKTFALENFI